MFCFFFLLVVPIESDIHIYFTTKFAFLESNLFPFSNFISSIQLGGRE